MPLISIVDETCKCAAEKNCKKVIILGTLFTMNSGLYSKAFKKYNIDAITPTEKEQQEIHNIIFPKLEDGIVDPDDKQKMLNITNGLIANHKADAVVLGCTELPLMIKEGDLDTLTLNTTEIHIKAILMQIF